MDNATGFRKILVIILAASLVTGACFEVFAAPSVADRIANSADALAKKNLPAYAIARFADAPDHTKERLRQNFEAVAARDPSAEMHPTYLLALSEVIMKTEPFREDGALFWAYAHLLLTLRKNKTDVAKSMENRKVEVKEALKKAVLEVGKSRKAAVSETTRNVFSSLNYDYFSYRDLESMRKNIEERLIGPETAYFKAFAEAKSKITDSVNLSLPIYIPHEKQVWKLSCESNSLRDLSNFYRLSNGKAPISEEEIVFGIPMRSVGPKYVGNKRIWGDPEIEFVGDIQGKQSSNKDKFTGYGIHAEGMLPYARRELKKFAVTLDKGAFDPNRIRESLRTGHPVMFWYVISTETSKGFARVEWETEAGKPIFWYVGQHTGVIIGAKLDDDGKISEVTYLEGKSEEPVVEKFETLARKAAWFNEAYYVSSPKKPFQFSVPKPRKKNVKIGNR